MSIPIIVNIEAGENGECGKCEHFVVDWCDEFHCYVTPPLAPDILPKRCPACLAGEKKLAALVKIGEALVEKQYGPADRGSLIHGHYRIPAKDMEALELALAAIKEP
jgi:hypothetical protein